MTAASLLTPRPPLRAALLVVAAVCGAVLAACAGLYFATVAFLVLSRTTPSQATLAGIVQYWQVYGGDPKLRKRLMASSLLGGGLALVAPLAIVGSSRRYRPLHGDARFASYREVARTGLLGRCGDHAPGIIVGRYRGRFLTLGGQLSVMLSAPTRSGKGVGVVIPNLLNWPHSAVVLDIKGENHRITSGYRASHGQALYSISPFDEEARSHRWNALSSVRTHAMYRVGDLLAIGQVFYPSDGVGSLEAFFNDQARNLFLGLGLYLLETPELPRTIGELLRQSSGKGSPLREHLCHLIEERERTPRPLSSECVDAFRRLTTTSENTLSSIVATFNAPLTIFADAIVDAATSGDDFDLSDVRRRRMTIYVRVPPNRLANAKPLLNLFFSQLVSLNTRTLPDEDPTLRYQCLLLNDEFTAMGRVGAISTSVAFLAGYNLRLLTVVQAMSQLDSVYGEKDARTFATNHGLQILYAPREQRDAEEYSAMLGYFTEQAVSRGRSRSFGLHASSTVSRNESQQRRALLLPQEFRELGSERLVLTLENSKPVLADKIRYHREAVFADRLQPPADVPQLDIGLHISKVQERIRDMRDGECGDGPVDLARVAHDFAGMPELTEASNPGDVTAFVDSFFSRLTIEPQAPPSSPHVAGGSIEPIDSDAHDGALDLGVLAHT